MIKPNVPTPASASAGERKMAERFHAFIGQAFDAQVVVQEAVGYVPSIRIELPAPAFDLWHSLSFSHPWDGRTTIEYNNLLTIVRRQPPF